MVAFSLFLSQNADKEPEKPVKAKPAPKKAPPKKTAPKVIDSEDDDDDDDEDDDDEEEEEEEADDADDDGKFKKWFHWCLKVLNYVEKQLSA